MTSSFPGQYNGTSTGTYRPSNWSLVFIERTIHNLFVFILNPEALNLNRVFMRSADLEVVQQSVDVRAVFLSNDELSMNGFSTLKNHFELCLKARHSRFHQTYEGVQTSKYGDVDVSYVFVFHPEGEFPFPVISKSQGKPQTRVAALR
ncbi:hypothetical protein BSKO_10954 [Bryopsis sp. KO-2023]|nr:hypothetical protein BSKO_10954 [Bryopsis sp. KO-2023]